MIRDITDRKLVEQELRLHEGQLEELVRKRTEELAQTNRMLQIEIVERREIEEELRKSEERYELAVRGGKEGLWDWNLKSNEIFLSIPWKSMLGYKDPEISNQPEEWLNRVHPDDLPKVNAELTSHLDGQTDHFECEYRILQKDGDYRWVLSRGAAIRDSDGNAIRVAGIQRDIQERKLIGGGLEAESLLRSADGFTQSRFVYGAHGAGAPSAPTPARAIDCRSLCRP